ncbi:SHOCT domain-containing protein [Pseudonocardia sp. RS010]|uniref:SHOCT domain-containing protein n=1 Tax=Pseudonocardia sp. RS010 TaxID=3385979 RepID=UPI0039A1AB4E
MMDGSMMGWAWVWPVLLLIGLALLGYLVFRLAQSRGSAGAAPGGGTRSEGSPGTRSSAQQILDERYARGEIDEAEYRRRRDELA